MFTCPLGVTSHTIYISACTECLTHLLGVFHAVFVVRCRKAKYRFILDLYGWSDFPTFCHTTFQDPTLRVTTAGSISKVAWAAMFVYFTVGVRYIQSWPLVSDIRTKFHWYEMLTVVRVYCAYRGVTIRLNTWLWTPCGLRRSVRWSFIWQIAWRQLNIHRQSIVSASSFTGVSDSGPRWYTRGVRIAFSGKGLE